MLKRKRFWVGVIVSLALIAFVINQTDPAKIWDVLRQAQYVYLLPALALYFAGVVVRAIRWRLLLRNIKPISTGALFRTIVIGYMANDILPARMGELVRAYVLGQQERISKTSTLVTIVVERLFDAVTMLIFIVAATLMLDFAEETLTLRVRLVGLFLIATLVGLAIVAVMPRQIEFLADRVIRRLPPLWHASAKRLTYSAIAGLGVLRTPRDALAALATSVIAWLCETGMYAVLAHGFGISLRFAVYLLAAAFANLVTIAPSTPGYVGVFDAPIVYTLTYFGVDQNLAASYTLVLHTALILPITLLGLYYAGRAGITLSQMMSRESEFGSAANVET